MVMAGAHLGAGVVVSGSIIGRSAQVGDRSAVTAGSVVGHDVVLAADTELTGATSPDPSTWQ